MRIKRLKVSGFKSFCHPIEIDFQQKGITIIVGPNGCGKSNVVDAIRWVLGEQSAKQLRGGSMEDVIFAGTEYQKPLGMAEVTLTFSNSEGDTLQKYHEYTEIAVTRRLYRSGESAYLINNTPVRLLDVRDLFMDTGIGGKAYSIIEQGKVGEIVNSRPIDRRHLIEDAAGISKFKAKRQTAEKRLEQTMQNLGRISDLLTELHRQEESLRDQVEKAKKFIDVRDQVSLYDRQLFTLRWQRAHQKEQQLAEKLQTVREKKDGLLIQKTLYETQLEGFALEQLQREEKLKSLREEVFQVEKKIQYLENQQALEDQNLKNSQDWIAKHSQEVGELEENLQLLSTQSESLEQTYQNLQKQYTNLEIEIKNIEHSVKDAEFELKLANEELEDQQQKLLSLHSKLNNNNNEQSFLQERITRLQEQQEKLEEQRVANETILSSVTEQLAEKEAQGRQKKEEAQHIELELQQIKVSLQQREEQIQRETQTLRESEYALQTTQSHLASLEAIQSSYEDFSDSVKAFFSLLEQNTTLKKEWGVLGVLADCIQIPSESLETVSAVLAPFLDWIVLQSSASLPMIEERCLHENFGRLQFICLDQQYQSAKTNHTQTSLLSFLSVNENATALADGVFQQIYCLESPQAWQNLRENYSSFTQADWFDPKGSHMDRYGAMHIGKIQSTSIGFLQRQNQIQELKTLQKDQEQKVTATVAHVETLEAEKQVVLEQQNQRQNQRHQVEVDLAQLRKEFEHIQFEKKRAEQISQQFEGDRRLLVNERQQNQEKMDRLYTEKLELEDLQTQVEEEAELQKELIFSRKQSVEITTEELLTHRVALTQSLEKYRSTEENVMRTRKEKTEGEQRLQTLRELRKQAESKLKNSTEAMDRYKEELALSITNREEQTLILNEQTEIHQQKMEERAQYTEKISQTQRELEKLMLSIHEEELKLQQLRLQCEQFEQQLLQQYNQSPVDLVKQFNIKELQEEKLISNLRRLRSQMDSLSHVNLGAPEEHEMLQERIQFLTQQSDDLNQAIHDLKTTIREINTESRRRFKETFEQVNANFKEFFTSLFGGGEAKMILTESEDVLEAGIEIVASPPGKKLQNLTLFSGGEKALTAISLIFSIFLIKPSPFCLLDEVDAPLDDANVGRFINIVKKLTDNSQFIVITHNKKTMQMGDLLYGVTMEESGISKTVSVQFQEAEKMVA